MLALLSPAKNLDLSPIERSALSQPHFLGDTELLMRTTRKLSPGQLKRLMKISDKLAELNHQRFQDFSTPFSPDNAKPAADMFAGDTYRGLQAADLSEADLVWGADHVAILSGLYGLLRPLDLVQPYRLEMGTKLKNARGADLYAFWRERVTGRINELTAGHPDRAVVNLASVEYFSAVDPTALEGGVVTPVFEEEVDGKRRVNRFFAKRARGSMARWILQNRIERREDLAGFDTAPWQFDRAEDDGARLVFLKG